MNDISREVNIIDSIIKRVPYDGPVLSRIEEKLMELKAVIEQGGGGGTSDYDELENRPAVNGHTLTGDQSGTDLGLVDDHGRYIMINGTRVYASATEPTGTIPDGSIWIGG